MALLSLIIGEVEVWSYGRLRRLRMVRQKMMNKITAAATTIPPIALPTAMAIVRLLLEMEEAGVALDGELGEDGLEVLDEVGVTGARYV
jgi:hypothetical protein